jgi:uncharacterized integral membrane protein
MKDLKLFGAIALAVMVAVFVLQNAEPVAVQFLAWTWEASRAIVPLVVFVVGAAAGWLARAGRGRRH